jgi:hypothetical protein
MLIGAVVAIAALVTGCATASSSSSAGSSWAATPATGSSATSGAATSATGSSALTVEPAAAVPGKWKSILTENFSGKTLNPKLWQAGWFGTGITSSVNTNDRACDSSSQVKVAGGQLRITAKRASIVCGGVRHSFTSGVISSNPAALGRGKGFQFTHGLIEFRVKVPGDGKGHCANWPSLWINGQQWPTDGEVDAFECLDGATTWNLHTGIGGGAYRPVTNRVKGNWVGWHTVAIDWTAHQAIAYFDGKKIGSNRYTVNHPNYIVISNQIRVGAKLVLPSTLAVDWVRVYKASSAKGAKRIVLKA